MVQAVDAFVALGSNLGDRLEHLRYAVHALARLDRSRPIAGSHVYETAPVGPAGQGPYLNAVVQLQTELGARDLLGEMLAIEARRGRLRDDGSPRWGPRVLDLDLILYGDREVREPGLEVPHPRLRERAFVLVPLCDLIPQHRHPGRTESFEALKTAIDPAGSLMPWRPSGATGDPVDLLEASGALENDRARMG